MVTLGVPPSQSDHQGASGPRVLTEAQILNWIEDTITVCLEESGGDVDAALSAAEYILLAQPLPEVDIPLAHDIHNRRAQGVLNDSLLAARKISEKAKLDLIAALAKSRTDQGKAILDFIAEYRQKLTQLLSATQMAALVEGAKDVAVKIPPLALFSGAAPIPPTLEPSRALEIVNRLFDRSVQDRAEYLYDLPVAEQAYIQQALAVKDAGGPVSPPPVIPTRPPAGSPEEIHFPVIEEAIRNLAERNVLTRPQYDALDAATRAKSFTVAGVDSQETLTKIRDALSEVVREGPDYRAWADKVADRVDEGTFLSEAHRENVFRTNVQTAFSDGQEMVLSNPLVRSGFPYRQRDAIHDDRVRKNHLALERMGMQGTNIYRADDPVWQLFRAPWDYNDRCSDTPITVMFAAEKGIQEAIDWLESGNPPAVPVHVSMPDFRPPPGFQRQYVSMPLSIQLSMQPISAFAIDARGVDHKGKGHQGGGQFTPKGVEDQDVSGQGVRSAAAPSAPAQQSAQEVGSRALDLSKKIVNDYGKQFKSKLAYIISTIDKLHIMQSGGGGLVAATGHNDLAKQLLNAAFFDRGGTIPSHRTDEVVAENNRAALSYVQEFAGALAKDPAYSISAAAIASSAKSLSNHDPVFGSTVNEVEDLVNAARKLSAGDAIGAHREMHEFHKTKEAVSNLNNRKAERDVHEGIANQHADAGLYHFSQQNAQQDWRPDMMIPEDFYASMSEKPPREDKTIKPVKKKYKLKTKSSRIKIKCAPYRSIALAVNTLTKSQSTTGAGDAGSTTSDQSGTAGAGGSGAPPDVRAPDESGGGVETQTQRSGVPGAGEGGEGAGQPAGPVTPAGPRRVLADPAEISRRGDRFIKWLERRTGGENWGSRFAKILKNHIETVGAERFANWMQQHSQTPNQEVAYDPGKPYSDTWGAATRSYLNHFGIYSAYNIHSNAKAVSSITPKHKESHIAENTDEPIRQKETLFQPAESGLTDKLKEAKNLPGLESSEDLGTIMGKPVSHLTPDVIGALDQKYGKGGWIIKPYTEDAFAGHGIYFPERIEHIERNAKDSLAAMALKPLMNQRGGLIGVQSNRGEHFYLSQPDKLQKHLDMITSNLPHYNKWEYTAQSMFRDAHAATGKGIPLLNREGEITNKGYMAQPAFAATDEEERQNRAEGSPYASTEARAHFTTKNGEVHEVPYAMFYKNSAFPIVFHTPESIAMKEAAKKAIMAQPESERQGHVYAPDIIKTGDPQNPYRVAELNPSNEVGSSGHLGSNAMMIDAYVSHLMGREPGFVQLMKRMATTRQRQKAMSIDQRGVHHRGKGPEGGEFTSPGLGEEDLSQSDIPSITPTDIAPNSQIPEAIPLDQPKPAPKKRWLPEPHGDFDWNVITNWGAKIEQLKMQSPDARYHSQSITNDHIEYLSSQANDYGMDFNEYRNTINNQAGQLLSTMQFHRREHDENTLMKVLQDGRFKSQFETMTSLGSLSPALRAKTEAKLFGLPLDAPKEFRPIYGYYKDASKNYGKGKHSAHKGFSDPASPYGGIVIRFKDSVKPRATVTFSDSLRYSDSMTSSPYNNVTSQCMALGTMPEPLEYIDDISNGDYHEYIEGQVHGQLKVGDIHSITFELYPPSPEMQKKLTDMGIPFMYTGRPERKPKPEGPL